LLLEVGAAECIADAGALAPAVARLLSDPAEAHRRGEAGRERIAGERGALARTLDLIEPHLHEPAPMPRQ